jgi:hypothetical protein
VDGEEAASVPELEIKQCSFAVSFQIFTLEVVDKIEPFAVEGDLLVLVRL